ncbi:hypothetical protein GCM10028807_04650 [Spirosoma daeguense]
MIHLLRSIIWLSCSYSLSQAQTVITQAFMAGQQHNQHSKTVLIAYNQIEAQACVTYWANQSIELRPGFTAKPGSIFLATIHTANPVGSDSPKFVLKAYPNPFRESTRLAYRLSAPTMVMHRFMNLQGQVVGQPFNWQWQEAGVHEIDVAGVNLSDGVYLYQVQAGAEQQTVRLVKQP